MFGFGGHRSGRTARGDEMTEASSPATSGAVVEARSPRGGAPLLDRSKSDSSTASLRKSPRGGGGGAGGGGGTSTARPPPPKSLAVISELPTRLPAPPAETNKMERLRQSLQQADGSGVTLKALFLQLMDDERVFVQEHCIPVGEYIINPVRSAIGGSIVWKADEQDLGKLFKAYDSFIPLHIDLLSKMYMIWERWDDFALSSFAQPLWLDNFEQIERAYLGINECAKSASITLRAICARQLSLGMDASLRASNSVSPVHVAIQNGCRNFSWIQELQEPFDRPWSRWIKFLDAAVGVCEVGDACLSDCQLAASAFDKLKSACDEVMRIAEDQKKVANIDAQIQGLPSPLADGMRYLIRFGKMDGMHDGAPSQYSLFLFNDILVICQRLGGDRSGMAASADSVEPKFSFVERIRLVDCDMSKGSTCDFSVSGYTFRARDTEACEKWLSAFAGARTRLNRTAQFGASLKTILAREPGNVIPSTFGFLVSALRELCRTDPARMQTASLFAHSKHCTKSQVMDARLALDKGFIPPGLAKSPDLLSLLLIEFFHSLPDFVLDPTFFEPSVIDAKSVGALDPTAKGILYKLCSLCEDLLAINAVSITTLSIIFCKLLCGGSHYFDRLSLVILNLSVVFGSADVKNLCPFDAYRKEPVLEYTHKKFARIQELKEKYMQDGALLKEGTLRLKLRKKPTWIQVHGRLHDQVLSLYKINERGEKEESPISTILLTKAKIDNMQDIAFRITPKLTIGNFIFAANTEAEKRAWLKLLSEAVAPKGGV